MKMQSDWKCPACETDVEAGFESCWNCGASASGKPASEFVREIDVATLPEDWIQRIRCESCGYDGKCLMSHRGYRWWTLPIALLLVLPFIEVIGTFSFERNSAIELNVIGPALRWTSFFGVWGYVFLILGNRRTKICPNCDSRKKLTDLDGADRPIPEQSSIIWEERNQRDLESFKRNKRYTLGIAIVAFLIFLGPSIFRTIQHSFQ